MINTYINTLECEIDYFKLLYSLRSRNYYESKLKNKLCVKSANQLNLNYFTVQFLTALSQVYNTSCV